MTIGCSCAAAAAALLAEIAPRRGNDQCAETAGYVGPFKCLFNSHGQNGSLPESSALVFTLVAPAPM